MFISFREVLDVIIMSALVGFIFSDVFKRPTMHYEPLKHFKKGMDWHGLLFAAMVTAPAIVLHELGHKTMATVFGATATFHTAYLWLLLGVALKLMNFGFIFFIPAYVAIAGNLNPLQHSLVAFSGPAVNLIIWIVMHILIRNATLPKKYIHLAVLTKRVNMFLFIFNMLPIPGFDGYSVFSGLVKFFV